MASVDLLAALRASIEAAKQRRSTADNGGRRRTATSSGAAKKKQKKPAQAEREAQCAEEARLTANARPQLCDTPVAIPRPG